MSVELDVIHGAFLLVPVVGGEVEVGLIGG